MVMSESPDRWRRVEALCQAALERPVAERDAFLRGACSDDDLRHEVETLLGRESAAERFLETGVGAAVASGDANPTIARTQSRSPSRWGRCWVPARWATCTARATST